VPTPPLSSFHKQADRKTNPLDICSIIKREVTKRFPVPCYSSITEECQCVGHFTAYQLHFKPRVSFYLRKMQRCKPHLYIVKCSVLKPKAFEFLVLGEMPNPTPGC